jgi:hypothetical protein
MLNLPSEIVTADELKPYLGTKVDIFQKPFYENGQANLIQIDRLPKDGDSKWVNYRDTSLITDGMYAERTVQAYYNAGFRRPVHMISDTRTLFLPNGINMTYGFLHLIAHAKTLEALSKEEIRRSMDESEAHIHYPKIGINCKSNRLPWTVDPRFGPIDIGLYLDYSSFKETPDLVEVHIDRYEEIPVNHDSWNIKADKAPLFEFIFNIESKRSATSNEIKALNLVHEESRKGKWVGWCDSSIFAALMESFISSAELVG